MTRFRSTLVVLLGTLLLFLATLPVFAQQTTNCGAGQTCLQNPLRFTSIERFIEGALQAMVMIALPIISVFIIWAGFMFVKARGKPNEISDAKKNLTYVLIGATLILSAWVLATLIGSTVSQLLRG